MENTQENMISRGARRLFGRDKDDGEEEGLKKGSTFAREWRGLVTSVARSLNLTTMKVRCLAANISACERTCGRG